MADPSFDITLPLNADSVFDYANTNNKPTDGTESNILPNKIDIKACVYQNVSDSVHDGLKETGAKSALPQGFDTVQAQHEDPHLEEFLYKLNKGTPRDTELQPHIKANYECYFRIPLFNGGNQNIDANGTPTYGNRVSVIETMLDKIGVASPNVFLSYDFGFPEVKYDIGYAKTRQFYVGYRPCQENDAAGKPTLSSSNAPGFGLLSTQAPVDFIWTNRAIEPFFTYLPRYTQEIQLNYNLNTPPSENYAISRFDMYIGWDRSDPVVPGDENEADVLKSCTVFYDPDKKELLLSNSDWTSKSGKDQKQYEKFSKELLSIKDKSPIELISPKPIIVGHDLQTAQFDLFHALAKNSGDKLTAITYPNSYTPEMLDSVINIIRRTESSFYSSEYNGHIEQLIAKPSLAGAIAVAIDEKLKTNTAYLDNIMFAMDPATGISDVITKNTDIGSINARESLRRKPRLFRKLKNKSEPITDPNNYDYMWLKDYVFVYVTHDRLAAACALERFVDIVLLESPRQDDKSVFSLFVRKNTIDLEKMLAKNIENMQIKITIFTDPSFTIKTILNGFGIALQTQYKSIAEIKGMFTQLQTYITANHSTVDRFNADVNNVSNDAVINNNIVNGLISDMFNQITVSYNKLYESFKTLLGIPTDQDISAELSYNINEHISKIMSKFINPLIQSFNRLNQPGIVYETSKSIFDETNSLFYKAKEYLQIYTAFQELSDKLTLLQRIQTPGLTSEQLLTTLAGVTDAHYKLLTQTTRGQIASLGPSLYKANNAAATRSGRTPKDWFSSSKDALKRVISGDLPNSFGLTKLFLKLIPIMNPLHVAAIFKHFQMFATANTSANTNLKLDFKIVINCLKAILPDNVLEGNDANVITKKVVEKLTEYDELFTLIVEEEKTMLKQLEKAGKLVTKCLSKKKKLLAQTKEAEIADKIKTAVETLIPQQSIMSSMSSMVGRRGGRKTAHKYKSIKSGKNTRKNRKSGGENVIPIHKDEHNIKPRIELFYRCITMYILYLTNVMELYEKLLKSIRPQPVIDALVTKLALIIKNISHIRKSIIGLVDYLASATGRTLLNLFGVSDANLIIKDSIEYFPKQVVGSTSNQMDISVPAPNKDQIVVLLEDSFNLHLVNVGTYLYNMELIQDDLIDVSSSLKDVVDELVEILNMSHSGLLEYIFVKDNDVDNGTTTTIDMTFARGSITPSSFNFGYTNALSMLLKTNQTYLTANETIVSQRFQQNAFVYNNNTILEIIKDDLIATGSFDETPINLTGKSTVIFQQQVPELRNGRIEETTNETEQYVDNSSLLLEEALELSDVEEILLEDPSYRNSDDESLNILESSDDDRSQNESDVYDNDSIADEHSDYETYDVDKFSYPVFTPNMLKKRKSSYNLPNPHSGSEAPYSDSEADMKTFVETTPLSKKASKGPRNRLGRRFGPNRNNLSASSELSKQSHNNVYRPEAWSGGKKTRRHITSLKNRKYTAKIYKHKSGIYKSIQKSGEKISSNNNKKYQKTAKRLRKTRKNTKRPKYIKKNVTKRRQ